MHGPIPTTTYIAIITISFLKRYLFFFNKFLLFQLAEEHTGLTIKVK